MSRSDRIFGWWLALSAWSWLTPLPWYVDALLLAALTILAYVPFSGGPLDRPDRAFK